MEVPSGLGMMLRAMGVDFDPAQMMEAGKAFALAADARLTALEGTVKRVEDKLDLIIHHMSLEATAEDRFAKSFGSELVRLPSEVAHNGGDSSTARNGSGRS